MPTVGINVKIVKKGGVKLKCWDLGGQEQYRSEWGRYTSGCDVVIYVVDSNAFDTLPTAKHELHRLLEDRSLATTPILVVANKVDLAPRLAQRPLAHSRARAFDVAPRVLFDNKASNKFTVIEVNARDRPALLNRLARALFESRLVIHSAHVTNYGERAADTFYITDLTGGKLEPGERMNRIEARLMEAASDAMQDRLENA